MGINLSLRRKEVMGNYFVKMVALSATCFGFAVLFITFEPKGLAAGLVTAGVVFALFAIRVALLEAAERIKY